MKDRGSVVAASFVVADTSHAGLTDCSPNQHRSSLPGKSVIDSRRGGGDEREAAGRQTGGSGFGGKL